MANETLLPSFDDNRRLRLEWILTALLQPRRTFPHIAAASNPIWHTPILILILTTLARVVITGSIQTEIAASGQITYPPGWEYYTPEQQAQFQQAISGMNSPTFHYYLPAIVGVITLIIIWLVVAWLVHLALTLRGGRGTSQQAVNITAWAALPFIVRDIVRTVAMMNTNQLIAYPGLSGFAPAAEGNVAIFITAVLSLIDIYFIWCVCLMGYGMRHSENLPPAKTWLGVIITMLLLLLVRALPALISAQFQNLTVIRPFF